LWLEGKFMHIYCLQRFPRMLQCLSKFMHIGNELEKSRMKLEKVFFCACIYHIAGCVFDRLDYRGDSA